MCAPRPIEKHERTFGKPAVGRDHRARRILNVCEADTSVIHYSLSTDFWADRVVRPYEL